jgi:hypothetical protein
MRSMILGFTAALLLLAGAAAAETVILKNGRRLRGKVTVNRGRVIVRNRRGTLRLNRRLVAEVNGHKKNRRQDTTGSKSGRSTTQEDGGNARPPVLQRKVTVHFQQAPLDDVLARLREATGAGFALGPGVDAHRLPPVTMHLEDATLKQVLDFLVQGSPRLAYRSVGEGNIRLGRRGSVRRRSVRVYDVKDRLRDRSDVGGGRGAVQGQFGGGFRGGTGSNMGFGGGRGGYGGRGAGGGYGRRGGNVPLRVRAGSFALLTARVVRPQSWNWNRIRVVGGAGRRGRGAGGGFGGIGRGGGAGRGFGGGRRRY